MNLFVNGFFLLLLLALSLPCTEAEVVSGIYSDPAHPGKCVVNPNLILNAGETAKHPNMECARIVCGESSFAKIQKCELELPLRYCKLGEPKFPHADYPICCPRKHICGHTRELPQTETIEDLQI